VAGEKSVVKEGEGPHEAPLATRGLSASEVVARRAQGLGNDVHLPTSRSYRQIVRANVFTFLNNVLFGLGLALVALGRPTDALFSVVVVLFAALSGTLQEIRAKWTLDRIALLTRPRATAIRDRREEVLDPSEIVVGDVLVVRPGDQIVVDGRVIEASHLDVDESLLTGESDAISKGAGDVVYSGTFCVAGSAAYEAQKVGVASLASQIVAGARLFRRTESPLQRYVSLVVKIILLIAIYFELLVLTSSILQQTPLVQSVLMSVVIAGLVPNGLFLAITTAYAVGAVRIARQGVLVQQSNALESLSSVDVLCLDKTGTLTTNALTLQELRPFDLSESAVRRWLGDVVASTSVANRTSMAIAAACPGRARQVAAEVPFSSAYKWSAIRFADETDGEVYVLGAPEILGPSLQPGALDETLLPADDGAGLNAWTQQGLRVLLFACASDPGPLYEADGKPRLPADLIPLAAIGLRDELRPEAQATLQRFAEAGVRLKIISGDDPRTVAALARQAGFGPDLKMVSGLDLLELSEAELARVADETTIFGRITPQQKERLVQALKRGGHHVAMIGDGVNDVLSLKQADLGIALQAGSQATRAVADIVLLHDSFAPLPRAVQEGQRILNGMQDIVKIFLTRELYVALLIVSVWLAVDSFPFTPLTISLQSLLTVGMPMLALAVWARPGPIGRHRMMRSLVHFVVPATLTITLIGLFVYELFLMPLPVFDWLIVVRPGVSAAQSALAIFTTLAGLLLIAFVEPPIEAWAGGDVCGGDWRPFFLALVLLIAFVGILDVPSLRGLFELEPLALTDHLLLALAAIGWAFLTRWVWRARLLERFLNLDFEGA
jgi:cation-transporting ATPase E